MSIKERKEREREEMRELILNTASKIISEEGLDSLSIRKIANIIEYSPAIIYHYFKDKDDIVDYALRRGYKKIVDALSSVPQVSDPQQRLKQLMHAYINAALQMPEEFKNVQLSSSQGALAHTSSLFKGASDKKPALAILCKCLKEIHKDMEDDKIELTAQVISTASFGLILRIITEKELDELHRNELIEHHVKCIIDVMVLGKPLNSI